MARTIRRKTVKEDRTRYTREEFDEKRVEFEAGKWRVHYTRKFKRPVRDTDPLWWRNPDAWVEDEYEYKGRWLHWEVTQFDTYDHYVAYTNARMHSDAGYISYRRGCHPVPKEFVNVFSTRPLRRKHKQQIHRAWCTEGWDELLLEPYIHDAAWLYY